MYRYELWLEGNCLTEGEGYYTEVEAQEEGYAEVIYRLYEEGYAEDGYDEDDFEIRTFEE